MANFLDDYEPVEDRLRAFWKDHPAGRVMTTLVKNDGGDYIVFAELFRIDGEYPAASGLAHDSVDQLPPNMKQSALEVCETSAIGRALANLGYAAKGKRPSREEMSKASGPVAAGDLGHIPGPDPGPDTSADGEAAGTAPGGQSKPPGVTKYPVDPAECTHRFRSGRWMKWDSEDRCPRCGTPKVSAVEGTTADLGSA